MSELISRAMDATVDDVLDGERAVVGIINTASVDRFNTVIEPGGVDLAEYRKNPVVLWDHGKDARHRGTLPIGRNLWIRHDRGSDRLIAKTKFHDDAFSDNTFKLYQARALNAFSVYGLADPATASKPRASEIRARPELARAQLVYRTLRLTEYSAVSVPGNADCLALAVSRGLELPEALEAARAAAAPPGPPAAPIGHCPLCGSPGVARERRPGGDDTCGKGHVYPSRSATAEPSPLPPLVGRSVADVQAAISRRVRAEFSPESRRALARDPEELGRGMV